MTRHRTPILAMALCAGLAPCAWSQEPHTPEPVTPPPPAAEDQDKVGFWGDEFALYVEAAYGSASLDPVNIGLNVGNDLTTVGSLSFDGLKSAQAAIGWTLPYERGSVELRFNGYEEDGYEVSVQGLSDLLDPGSSLPAANEPVRWWDFRIEDGVQTAEQFPPLWVADQDDANGNGIPDPDELRYSDTPEIATSREVADSLDNRFWTADALYRRAWGKLRWGGRWHAGLRSFQYRGNLVVPTWLMPSNLTAGLGFTDGRTLSPLVMSQRTSGYGPVGGMGGYGRFLRERLDVYGHLELAFLLQTLETDSGEFYTYVGESNVIFPASARLEEQVDKDVWHVMLEFGARYEIAAGFSVKAEYYIGAFQDAMLITSTMSIPESTNQAVAGTAARYTTQDLRIDGWRVGLRYQF